VTNLSQMSEDNFFERGHNSGRNIAVVKRLNKALYLKILAADIIADPKTWPLFWIDKLFTGHKDRRERYRLFVFLWKNGVPPDMAMDWTLYHGINTRYFGYDRSAYSSLWDAVKDTKTQEGRAALNRTRCLDLTTGLVD